MFSVIIPIHNKLPHLERSINSVLNQSYKNFELILIDDASTDGSSNKLLEFKDERIRKFRREIPGPGGYAARNLGIKEATNEWISFLDADDEWEIDYLSNVNKVIIEHEAVEIVTAGWVTKEEGNEKVDKTLSKNVDINSFTLTDYLLNGKFIWTGAANIKKEVLVKAGTFPAGKCKRGGDVDTWLRCLLISKCNIRINKVLVNYYRDTVNRVTDISSNPITKLCSIETLNSIRENTNDKKLLFAIDVFYSKYIYGYFLQTISQDKPLDLSLIKEIRFPINKLKVFVKSILKMIINKSIHK